MGNSVNVVPLIDTSNSMSYYGYVAITQRDSNAFISYALPGDGIGITSYDANGRINYPTSGTSLVIVDQNLNAVVQATNAINAMSFNGPSTNIGGGILSARSMLDNATAPKAIVLLTDGYQNSGTDPLTVLPPYPIYTCAMGNNADTRLLKQIADGTGGKAYVAPYPSTMMLIFNDIRALPTGVQSVQNVQNSIISQGYAMVPATFSNNNLIGQFGVVWDNNAITWTSTPNPGTNQVSITLVQPNGSLLMNPVISESGYVVFNQPAPGSGQWYVQIIAGNLPNPLQVTSGAFEFNTASGIIALNVTAPSTTKAGNNFTVNAAVTDGGEPVEGLQMTARIEKPSATSNELSAIYADQLAKVEVNNADYPDHLSDVDKRIAALRTKLLPEKDILAPSQVPGILKQPKGKQKEHTLEISDTAKPGIYNVQVQVTGYSPVSNSPFQRSSIVTVEVK